MKGWTHIMSTDTKELASQNGKTAAATAGSQLVDLDITTKVRYAAALGWAMTELLGRCFLIESGYHKLPEQPQFSPDDYPVILSPVLDPVERIWAVTGRILYLAKQLEVQECKIKSAAYSDISPDSVLDEMLDAAIKNDDVHEHAQEFKKLRNWLKEHPTNRSAYQPEETCIYVKILEGLVQKLSASASDSLTEICIAINFLLFYWSESIQLAFQEYPPTVYNAYTVGRGFATIRWYIGIGLGKAEKLASESDFRWYLRWCTGLVLPEKMPDKTGKPGNKRGDKLVTIDALNKLRDHLHSIWSYLPPFVPEALDYSLDIWGQVIIDNIDDLNRAIKQDQDEKIAKNKGEQTPTNDQGDKKPRNARQVSYERMRIALCKQSIIWHDLLSGDRDPTSYVNPQAITWRFTRWLVVIGTGFLALGVIFFAAIFFAVTHIQNIVLQQPLTKPTAGTPQSITDTIITAVATIPLIRTLWVWAARTTTNFTTTFMAKEGDAVYGEVSTSGKDALHLLWQKSQQEAINRATYRSPKPSLFLRVFPFLLRIPKKDGDGDDGD